MVILYDYFWLLKKKLKLNIDQIKTRWGSIVAVSNTYIHNTYKKTILFQFQQKLQYAGIVRKVKFYDITNRDLRVIGL